VLSVILSAGESSRLNRRLVRDDHVALQAGSQAMVREDPGLFLLFGAYLDPTNGAKVESALLDEVAKVRDKAPSAHEVDKAKNQLLSSFVFGLESVTGLARQIGTSWVHTGDPGHFLSEMAKFNAVTAADVQRVARKYLDAKNLTLVVIPAGGAAGAGQGGES
jgi:zinc protease